MLGVAGLATGLTYGVAGGDLKPHKGVTAPGVRFDVPAVTAKDRDDLRFGLAQGDKGKTRVTFVWEPTARVPGDRQQRSPSRIEL